MCIGVFLPLNALWASLPTRTVVVVFITSRPTTSPSLPPSPLPTFRNILAGVDDWRLSGAIEAKNIGNVRHKQTDTSSLHTYICDTVTGKSGNRGRKGPSDVEGEREGRLKLISFSVLRLTVRAPFNHRSSPSFRRAGVRIRRLLVTACIPVLFYRGQLTLNQRDIYSHVAD